MQPTIALELWTMTTLDHAPRAVPTLDNELSSLERFITSVDLEVSSRMFSFFPWPDLISISATSSLVNDFVTYYKGEAWDANRFLAAWFEESVDRFKSLLALTNAVVTGPQLLQFFDRLAPLEDAYLDIVTRIAGATSIILYLQQLGYERTPLGPSIPSERAPAMRHIFQLTSTPNFHSKGWTGGVLTVMEFMIPNGRSENPWFARTYERSRLVQLVVVVNDPVDHIMMNYHSSECLPTTLNIGH